MASMKFNSVGPILEESISQVTATPSARLGDRRVVAGEEYVYCYNAGGAQISVNKVAKLVTGASAYSVAATALTDVFSPAVGVVKHSTMAAADYGWVMTKGFATVSPVSATTADYVALACGASGSVIAWAATGATQGIQIGVALGADTGAAGSLYAYINTGF
jgi:hypothetical protein